MSDNFKNSDLNEEGKNFDLPHNYFENSANSILNKIALLEELKEFEYLSQLKKSNGFIIPKNYFEKNEVALEIIAYSNLSKLKKSNPFITPQDYFEINSSFLNSPNSENKLNAFENLNAINKQNSFIVTDNYFENSNEKIQSALIKPTKVIRLFSAKVWYSSAAAVLTITFGLWIYSQYFKTEEKDCGTLACIDKVDLVKAKNLENVDTDDLYDLVDTKKLENKLNGGSENKKEQIDTSLEVSLDDLPDGI